MLKQYKIVNLELNKTNSNLNAESPIKAAYKAYNRIRPNYDLKTPGEYLIYSIQDITTEKVHNYIGTDIKLNGSMKTRPLVFSLPKDLKYEIMNKNITTFLMNNGNKKLDFQLNKIIKRYNKEYDRYNSNKKLL